jgi:hypothetical protein
MTFLFSSSNRTKVIEAAIERQKRKQEEVEKQIRNEVIQKPLLYLAKNRDYDEILFVLINTSINVRDWIDVGKTNVARRSSIKTLGSIKCTSSVTNRRLSASLANLSFIDNIDVSESSLNLDSPTRKQLQQESVLHLILKYDPPVEIIDLLIQRMKEYNCFVDGSSNEDNSSITPEVIVDTKGRTPLHVAASVGSSYDIVLRLVGCGTHHDLSVCPAFLKDSMKRFALHWACTNPSTVEVSRSCLNLGAKGTSRSPDNYNLLKVIQLLVQINPEAVIEKDINGETSIDIAKKNLVKDEILRVLEKVAKWLEEERTKKTKDRSDRRTTKQSKTAKQSKFDSSFGTFTSRTSATTNTTKSSSLSSPELKYNNTRVDVTMKLSNYVESETANKSATELASRKAIYPTGDDSKPSIPTEIFQNIEILSDNYGNEYRKGYAEIQDDVSSVGSGGISTCVPQRRQRVLTQI